MTIREYSENDKDQIQQLMLEFGNYLESLDTIKRTNYAEGGEYYFTDKMLEEVSENDGQIYVAEEDAKIIGFIAGYVGKQTQDELMESRKETPGIINELFITREFRGSGIGNQLLAKLEQYLKLKGCTLIRLEVFAPNKIARNFYSKHGYQDRSVVVSKAL